MSFEFLDMVAEPARSYLISLFAFLVSIIVLYVIKKIIIVRLEKLAAKTKTKVDDILIDAVEKIGWPFYFILALYIAIQFVVLPASVEKGLLYLILIVVTYYFVKAVGITIDHFTVKRVEEKEKIGKAHEAAVMRLTSKIGKITLWLIAIIFILSNLGFNISSLIAGLGIGGIAIALALQNVLGDVFSSLSIYWDKPFEIGDFIILGDDMGTVKKIGIKSTRIQTLKGQELVVSNRELTNIRINNYKQMKKRRYSKRQNKDARKDSVNVNHHLCPLPFLLGYFSCFLLSSMIVLRGIPRLPVPSTSFLGHVVLLCRGNIIFSVPFSFCQSQRPACSVSSNGCADILTIG